MKTCDLVIHTHLFRTLLPLVVALLMTSCTEPKKPATQVVARVNDDEISIHQVNNALAQLPNVPVDSVDAVRKQILAKLVNQQLAVQQAEEQKMDRSPQVMMQIDEAKREILTRAYLGRLVAGLPKPTEEDAKKFYQSHPLLFSQRHIYKIQEIALETPNPPVPDLIAFAKGKSMEDIAGWLRKQNISYTMHSGTRAAEQIPLNVLPELALYKDGQTGMFKMSPQSIVVMHLDSSQLAPIDEKTAMQRIPTYLANEQAKLAINSDLERLKTKAKIEYLGEFSGLSPNHTGQPAPVVAEAEQPKPPTEKPQSDAINVEKGLAGLK